MHVPYKGGGPAMTDLLAGHIPSSFASAPTAIPQVKAGKIRVLRSPVRRARRSCRACRRSRSPIRVYDVTNWYAFVAPAKTPKEIVDATASSAKVLATPEVREQLLANGMGPEPLERRGAGEAHRQPARAVGQGGEAGGIEASSVGAVLRPSVDAYAGERVAAPWPISARGRECV